LKRCDLKRRVNAAAAGAVGGFLLSENPILKSGLIWIKKNE